ncbi:hypothetical protein [Corynebacterium sp. J010B-136]|uniref:hypothetical protein n=1 Tax=Corynebacterium sp. J010B-136 TaxID=2099401 RepID=UPI001304996A|nr:hypothetical protein [Corynebacterium sp. J010B-136]
MAITDTGRDAFARHLATQAIIGSGTTDPAAPQTLKKVTDEHLHPPSPPKRS